MKDRTKKLLKIGGLAAALALIGGTFAFTNFGQRALNITEDTNRPQYGARVHDYFDDASGNKDVFFENFGQDPVFVRVQLKELFLRNGIPLNNYGENDSSINANAPETWPIFYAGIDANGALTGGRTDVTIDDGGSPVEEPHFLNNLFRLNFGQTGSGDDRPWFMPTFNMDPQNLESAAAGRALDGETGEATHPGDGTANFWNSGDVAFALPGMTGHETEEHSARQVLDQDRPPVSMAYWVSELAGGDDAVGKYWIVDSESGWAYWADFLMGATPGNADGGEATSFLIDSKAPQAAGLGDIRVDWTYKLDVFGAWEPATDAFVNDFVDNTADNNANERRLIEEIWNYHMAP